jgi:hypothetical protein
MLPRCIVTLLLVVLPLTRVTAAWGEESSADSTAVETGLIKSNTPAYNGSIIGGASRLNLTNGFSNSLDFSNGLNMTTTMRIGETKYREQDREDITKELSHNMVMMVKPGFMIGGLLTDRRVNNRTLSFTGELQNYVQNKQQATANANYTTSLREGVNVNGWSKLYLTKDQLNFKIDESLKQDIGGGLKLKKGDRLAVEGRTYWSRSGGRAEAGNTTITGLNSWQDSLMSKVNFQVTDSARVGFEYVRYNSERRYVDLPRGVFLEQDLKSSDFVTERELRNSRIMALNADVKPLRGVSLKMEAEREELISEYAIEQRRSSRTVTDFLKGNLSYSMGKNTETTVMLEERQVLHDQGPQSVSSYDEKQQNFTFMIRHTFTPVTSWNLQATTSLRQVFYLDFETTPRDWDQLKQGLNSSIRSKLFSKVDVNIMLSATSIDVVNIHTSLSSDNRKETTYDLRPILTYRLNDRIEIKQEYSLNIDFTDYVFNDEDNFLDRNIRFSNTVLTHLTDDLEVDFYYGLHFHNGGSYLRDTPDAERLLSIDSEDRKDEAQLKCRYHLNENLTVLCEQKYSIRIDKLVGTGVETKFEDGEVRGGVRGNYNWGTGKSLNFSMVRVKRFGRYNTDAQNDYWEMDARMNYQF